MGQDKPAEAVAGPLALVPATQMCAIGCGRPCRPLLGVI
jgi:hypothetical protein